MAASSKFRTRSLRAFRAAFAGDDIGLLLKVGVRFGANAEEVLATIANEWRPLRGVAAPPLFVIIEDLSDAAVSRLYQRADAYVSLHHAEGFGLCLAQAMAAERPVVATGYSANLEFMDSESAFLVEHELVPVTQYLAPYPFFESGMHWAQPRLDSAVAALRACAYESTRRTRVAERGLARVRAELSPERIGARMRTLLG